MSTDTREATPSLQRTNPERAPEPEQKARKKSPFARVNYAGRKPKINKFFDTHQEVYRKILMFIEQGVYDYVAAEAMGICHGTWLKWMRQGEKDYDNGKRSNYALFFNDVRTSQARGRLLAELEVRRDDPKFFLRCGPGKTRPGRPGWTETIHVGGDEDMPLEVEVTQREEPSVGDLAATLVLMEQLGLATPTVGHGQSTLKYGGMETEQLIEKASKRILDVPSSSENELEGGENGEDADDTDDEEDELFEQKEKGYYPEKDKPINEIEYDNLPDEYK